MGPDVEQMNFEKPAVAQSRAEGANLTDGLERCPFCGGEANFATVTYSKKTLKEQNWGQDTFHFVSCIKCASSNRGLVGHRTQQKAAEHWNKRSNAKVSGAGTASAGLPGYATAYDGERK